eukprot:SAG22_NODE_51_length_24458_cov_19.853161_10_plen_470_part_00
MASNATPGATSFATDDYSLPSVVTDIGNLTPDKIFDKFQKRCVVLQGNDVTAVSPFQPNASEKVAASRAKMLTERRSADDEQDRSSSWRSRTNQISEGDAGIELKDDSLIGYIRDELIQGFIASTGFRMFSLAMIVLNSVLVGVQTNERLEQAYAWGLNAIDYIFLTIFTMEILLKWCRGFGLFWKSGWNVFDFVLVAISLVGQGLSFMSSGRVLRIMRVLRAFRTIRSIRMVRGLQMIVNTVFRSLPDMGNIFMLMGIVMYIFAIVGVTLFKDYVPQHFGSLPLAMYTLYVALTQDGWAKVFTDMDRAALTTQSSIYFFLFIIIGAFIFMNIISGVIVTNFQHAHEEHRRTTQLKFRTLGNPAPDWAADRAKAVARISHHSHCDPNRVNVQTRLPGGDRIAIKSLKPSFTQVEIYVLTIAAMERNRDQYHAMLTQLSSTIGRVHEFNAALNRDVAEHTIHLGIAEQYL